MKLIGKVLAALALTIGVASASCPPNMPYGCQQGANGKMKCGCGY